MFLIKKITMRREKNNVFAFVLSIKILGLNGYDSQECLSCFHTVTFYVALNTKTKMWVFKKASFSTYISGNSWLVKKKKKKTETCYQVKFIHLYFSDSFLWKQHPH